MIASLSAPTAAASSGNQLDTRGIYHRQQLFSGTVLVAGKPSSHSSSGNNNGLTHGEASSRSLTITNCIPAHHYVLALPVFMVADKTQRHPPCTHPGPQELDPVHKAQKDAAITRAVVARRLKGFSLLPLARAWRCGVHRQALRCNRRALASSFR